MNVKQGTVGIQVQQHLPKKGLVKTEPDFLGVAEVNFHRLLETR